VRNRAREVLAGAGEERKAERGAVGGARPLVPRGEATVAKKLPFHLLQVVPATLLTFTQAVLRERFSSFISKAVYTFVYDRSTVISARLVRVLHHHQPFSLAFTRYCHYQYCMLNGKTGRTEGNHILRNIDCEVQRGGGALKKVLNDTDMI